MLIRPTSPASWMRNILWAAAIYHLMWGVVTLLLPQLVFAWVGMPPLAHPELWQWTGVMAGAYGLGYAIAATDPFRHWALILVGLIGKLCIPIGFAVVARTGGLPWKLSWAILVDDVIWWAPFALILLAAYRATLTAQRTASPEVQRMALRMRTQLGVPLLEMSMQRPVLLVFLRHSGCPFCRETLSDLAQQRTQIEAAGAHLALVHMSEESEAPGHRPPRILQRYGLADVPRISDPSRHLYRAFGLTRGSFTKLFGPLVWWRGFISGMVYRHGLGLIDGDGFQMPGVFLVYHGEVVRGFHHQSAADRPDYVRLASIDA